MEIIADFTRVIVNDDTLIILALNNETDSYQYRFNFMCGIVERVNCQTQETTKEEINQYHLNYIWEHNEAVKQSMIDAVNTAVNEHTNDDEYIDGVILSISSYRYNRNWIS